MEVDAQPQTASVQEPTVEHVDALIESIELQPDSKQLQSLKQLVARLRTEVVAEKPASANTDARRIAEAGRVLWNKAKTMYREADDAAHSELECELRSVAQDILGSALLIDLSLDMKPFFVRCAECSEAWMDLADATKECEDDCSESRDDAIQTYCAQAVATLALHDKVLATRGDSNAGALVDILLAKSRVSFIQGDMDESLRVIGCAREKVETSQPDKAEKLAARVFEFGLQRVQHSDAVPWLELSVDVQQKIRLQGNHSDSDVSNQKLVATYLMLAHCFLHDQRYDTCEVAAKKAEAIRTTVASASLLLQCSIAQGRTADAKGHLNDLIEHADIADNVPLACSSLKIAAASGLDTEPSVTSLLANPMIGPTERLATRVFRLETAVAGNVQMQSISSICEDIRQHHSNEQALKKLDNPVAIALLERIDSTFKRWDDEDAEAGLQAVDDTYLCCEELLKFDFVTPEQQTCIARILCYAKLRQNDVAGSDQYLQQALATDPSSLVTQVLRWKHSVQANQASVSKDALEQIVQMEHDDKHSLLVSMTQTALEHGHQEIYLQCLQEQFRSRCGNAQQRIALLVDMVKVVEQLGAAASANLMKTLTDMDMKMVKSEADDTTLQYAMSSSSLSQSTGDSSLLLCDAQLVDQVPSQHHVESWSARLEGTRVSGQLRLFPPMRPALQCRGARRSQAHKNASHAGC